MSNSSSNRSDILANLKNTLLVPTLAIVTAIVLGGLVIAAVGGDPIAAYKGLFEGAFGTKKAISETAIWASPYIFAGLAVALAFKGGLFNIGGEGQLALGATAAAWVGYALPGLLGFDLPILIHLPLSLAAGMLVGFLWGVGVCWYVLVDGILCYSMFYA